MNAVIALCSFCETHGPRVVFCTQAFHDPEFILGEDGSSTNKPEATPRSFYGPPELADCSSGEGLETCEGCTSVGLGKRGYKSNDHEARVTYISSQYPQHPDLFTKVKQACFQSLSCEVSSAQGECSFFGNEQRGYILSHVFILADSKARGFHCSYSIIVIMKDKPLLLNSWKFFEESLKKIVQELKEKADKVHADEQLKSNPRAERLNAMMSQLALKTHLRKHKNIQTRSLKDLTNDKEIFAKLHNSFVWILCTGAKRIKEQLVEGSLTEDTRVDLEHHEDTEGFLETDSGKESDCSASSVPHAEKDLDVTDGATSSSAVKSTSDTGLTISSVRELFNALGQEKFHILAYHTIIGNQIIVKGQYPSLAKSLVNCLEVLLPKGCFHPIYDSTTYEDSWKYNFLVLPEVPIPDHVASSELHIQVNITKKKENEDINKLEDFNFTFVTTAKLPEKAPQVLCEVEHAISDMSFSLDALNSFILTQKDIWLNKVKMIYAYTNSSEFTEAGVTQLSTILGAKEQDVQVLKFWRAGLSKQQKTSVLSTEMKNIYKDSNVKEN